MRASHACSDSLPQDHPGFEGSPSLARTISAGPSRIPRLQKESRTARAAHSLLSVSRRHGEGRRRETRGFRRRRGSERTEGCVATSARAHGGSRSFRRGALSPAEIARLAGRGRLRGVTRPSTAPYQAAAWLADRRTGRPARCWDSFPLPARRNDSPRSRPCTHSATGERRRSHALAHRRKGFMVANVGDLCRGRVPACRAALG